MHIIRVKDLRKKYENVEAVKGVSFDVRNGTFFALLGQNGAGKSTTIEIIATLKSKNEGEVIVDGAVLGKDDDAIRKTLGVVFQYSVLDKELTVRENLAIRAGFYNMDKERLRTRIETFSSLMDIDAFIDRRVKTLSGGERRKADLARALLHSPKVLILDEPTTGLDPKSRKDLWELIQTIKTETDMTIFLTTHYMEEVLDADHVVILDEGLVKAEDSAENLRLKHASDTLRIVPKDARLSQALKDEGIPFTWKNSIVMVPLKDAFEGLSIATRHKAHFESFEIVKANMDDVFLNITGKELLENGTENPR